MTLLDARMPNSFDLYFENIFNFCNMWCGCPCCCLVAKNLRWRPLLYCSNKMGIYFSHISLCGPVYAMLSNLWLFYSDVLSSIKKSDGSVTTANLLNNVPHKTFFLFFSLSSAMKTMAHTVGNLAMRLLHFDNNHNLWRQKV